MVTGKWVRIPQKSSNEGTWQYLAQSNLPYGNREDGPVVIGDEGMRFWKIKSRNHRLDGPAMVISDTERYYAVWGIYL